MNKYFLSAPVRALLRTDAFFVLISIDAARRLSIIIP